MNMRFFERWDAKPRMCTLEQKSRAKKFCETSVKGSQTGYAALARKWRKRLKKIGVSILERVFTRADTMSVKHLTCPHRVTR